MYLRIEPEPQHNIPLSVQMLATAAIIAVLAVTFAVIATIRPARLVGGMTQVVPSAPVQQHPDAHKLAREAQGS
jgi:hypothetical protein